MENKTMYKCSLCGAMYDDAVKRAHCEIYCNNKRLEEEAKAAEAKKAAEFDVRLAEVNAAFDKAYTLRDKLVADYGEHYYCRKFNNLNLEDVLNRLFGV